MEEGEGKGSENDAQFQAEVAQREADVKSLLAKKDKGKALSKALENPPLWAKSSQIKVIFFIIFSCD